MANEDGIRKIRDRIEEIRERYEGPVHAYWQSDTRYLLSRIEELEAENERLRGLQEAALVELQTLTLTEQLGPKSIAIGRVASLLSSQE